MKIVCVFVLCAFCHQILSAQSQKEPPNVFIITIDGFRWQEIFNGGDPSLMTNTFFVKDTGLLQEQFGGATTSIRRKNLLPFFWNTIAGKGQLYGNRSFNNKADVKNFYKISYSGYNEIFSGYADPRLVPNTPRINKNSNLPGYLNTLPAYKGRCVAFSSWNIFPYILNEQENNFTVNSGYEMPKPPIQQQSLLTKYRTVFKIKKPAVMTSLLFCWQNNIFSNNIPGA